MADQIWNGKMYWGGHKVDFDDAEIGKMYVLQCLAANPSGYGNVGTYKIGYLRGKKHGGFLFWETDVVVFEGRDDHYTDEYTLRKTGDFVLMEYDGR